MIKVDRGRMEGWMYEQITHVLYRTSLPFGSLPKMRDYASHDRKRLFNCLPIQKKSFRSSSREEKELFNFYGDRKKELINVSRDTVFLGGMEAEVWKE